MPARFILFTSILAQCSILMMSDLASGYGYETADKENQSYLANILDDSSGGHFLKSKL